MDSSAVGPRQRPFRPVAVGTCYAQTAHDRFGPGSKEIVARRENSSPSDSPMLGDPDAEDDWDESEVTGGAEMTINQLVPTMQRYRNNLTALSQVYNFYFVAYHGQIFVYVPTGVPKQSLPRHPHLRLVPLESENPRRLTDCQDPLNPHSINQLVVGAFGAQEAVVACFDDGDVAAYLTDEIAEWINSRSYGMADGASPVQDDNCRGPRKDEPAVPRPFLYENVGRSAWGLAVHQKSRLIAVSSNRREITVFALGLTSGKKSAEEEPVCECCKSDCSMLESHVRQRFRNLRILIHLGHQADNLPNLSFIDDDQGSAEMVCAVDIKGAAWLAYIWKPSQAAIRIDPSYCVQLQGADDWPAPPRGWGILALPKSSFIRVNTVAELLGFHGRDLDVLRGTTLNVESHLQDIPDNPCIPPLGPTRRQSEPNVLFPDFEWPILGLPAAPAAPALPPFPPPPPPPPLLPLLAAPAASATPVGHPSNASSQQGVSLAGITITVHQSGQSLPPGEESSEVGINGTDEPALVHGGLSDSPASTAYSAGTTTVISGPAEHQWQALDASLGPHDVSPTLLTALSVPMEILGLLPYPAECIHPRLDAAFAAAQMVQEQDGGGAGPGAMLDMLYVPHQALMLPMPRTWGGLLKFFNTKTRDNNKQADGSPVLARLAKRYHVLRLYEKEIELFSLDREDNGRGRDLKILCPHALDKGHDALDMHLRSQFRATSRLSMVVHVAELSLVVVGSPTGRVLLVTPTRLASAAVKTGRAQVRHGFRVDWILPRRSDEVLYRKPGRPLHGVAVGPVQERGRGGAGEGWSGPRRYRLMLHYRNHDILTYEVSRDEHTGRVCIF